MGPTVYSEAVKMGEYMYYKGAVYLKYVDSAVKQAYIKEISFLKEPRNISVTLHCSSWKVFSISSWSTQTQISLQS